MIESHVVSFDLARKLHELGVKKESVYYWVDGKLLTNFNDTYLDSSFTVRYISPYSNFERYALNKTFVYPAYLASELGEMLPSNYTIDIIDGTDCHNNTRRSYYIHHQDDSFDCPDTIISYNVCDAIAEMLIQLIKNGQVKVEDLNL